METEKEIVETDKAYMRTLLTWLISASRDFGSRGVNANICSIFSLIIPSKKKREIS